MSCLPSPTRLAALGPTQAQPTYTALPLRLIRKRLSMTSPCGMMTSLHRARNGGRGGTDDAP